MQPAKLITNVIHFRSPRKYQLMTCKNSEVQKIQRTYVDELDADHDLQQGQFGEFEFDTGTVPVDAEDLTSDVLGSAPSNRHSSTSLPRRVPRRSRRELVWKSQEHETAPLEDIARQFQGFLITFTTELTFNRRHGRYSTKTAHRCPGYNRIEITLTSDITRSAIVSHLTPTPHEICPICKEIVKDAEIFACICGGDGKSANKHNAPCTDFFSR